MGEPGQPLGGDDEWEGGLVFGAEREVRWIEARGGLVVAGGAALYRLEPGDREWRMHPPPEELGPVHLVAVEPRGARQYAVAAGEMFVVVCDDGDRVLGVPAPAGVRQLAWGGTTGPSTLYALLADGALMRMRPAQSSASRLSIEPMAALASDDNGVIAMAALRGEMPRVFVTRNGSELKYRAIDHPIDPYASVQMAVADAAVALVVDGEYVLVSRGLEAPFERVELLDSPKGSGWTLGPVAFQGTSSDAALLCAQRGKVWSSVVRVDPSGAAMSVAKIGTIGPEEPPELAALSWDVSRGALWGASLGAGVFMSSPPGATGKKKVPPS